MPLEGLQWAHDMLTFISSNKDQLLWTLMIMQPDLITAALADEAVAMVKKKNPQARYRRSGLPVMMRAVVPRRCIRGRLQKRGQP
jgi:hypothetical protein